MYYVYFLYSKKIGKYYTGSTDNIERRLSQHNNEKVHYTRTGLPWVLIGFEEFQTKESALIREKWIKKMKSKKIIMVIIRSYGWKSPDE